MLILGIETSCDDTSLALLEVKGDLKNFSLKAISNVVSSQIKLHAKYGGVVPNLASREHLKNIRPVLETCLKESGLNFNQAKKKIDLICVTRGPGLIPSLLIGVNFAKALSYAWQKPLIGVNHLSGHLYSFLLPSLKTKNIKKFKEKQLKDIFPAICLLVSGGHTQLIYMKNLSQYRIIGETRDDAAGECFDKSARLLGLKYPGGPEISKQAEIFNEQFLKTPTDIALLRKLSKAKLPRPMINSTNYDFSFSGLKTAVLYLVQDLEKQNLLSDYKTILAYEIQNAIVDVLIKKTMKAAEFYKVKSVMLSGGVSANKLLRQEMLNAAQNSKRKINFFAPELAFTTDNALMVASAGFFEYLNNSKQSFNWFSISADANLSL